MKKRLLTAMAPLIMMFLVVNPFCDAHARSLSLSSTIYAVVKSKPAVNVTDRSAKRTDLMEHLSTVAARTSMLRPRISEGTGERRGRGPLYTIVDTL